MRELRFRPVSQSQFATLFVDPDPAIGEDGYANYYPTIERALRALPRKHGGVLVVTGKHKRQVPIRIPKHLPVTIVGGEYTVGRKAKAFVEVPKGGKKASVFTGMHVEFPIKNAGKQSAMSFKV